MSVLIHTEGSVAPQSLFPPPECSDAVSPPNKHFPVRACKNRAEHQSTRFLQPPGANAGGMGFPASRRDPR
ncbi:hypothetical protein CXU01_05680 [Akkermansia muciniphila]|nr:hypothetical protein CXU01_05680 [Akkermansia muciniphila]